MAEPDVRVKISRFITKRLQTNYIIWYTTIAKVIKIIIKKRNNTANAVLPTTSAKLKEITKTSETTNPLEHQRIRRFMTNFFFNTKKK